MTKRFMKNLAIGGAFPGETAGDSEPTPIWFVALILMLMSGVPVLVASVLRW